MKATNGSYLTVCQKGNGCSCLQISAYGQTELLDKVFWMWRQTFCDVTFPTLKSMLLAALRWRTSYFQTFSNLISENWICFWHQIWQKSCRWHFLNGIFAYSKLFMASNWNTFKRGFELNLEFGPALNEWSFFIKSG